MEFLSSLSSFIVTAIILIGIPVGVIWLIVAVVKKQSKKVPRNILIGCVAGIVIFSVIGGSAWSETDDYAEYQAEKEEQEALVDAEKEQKDNTSNNDFSTQTEIETESEVETEVVETESEINVDELSEEEYKALCQVIYNNEDLMEEKVQDGQYVKLQMWLTNKYKYSYGDMFWVVINKLTQKYDLEEEYFEGGALNRDNDDQYSATSYVGESVYLLFNKEYSLSIDDFEEGDHVVVYGEMVQTWSGYFVMPKYMEVVDGYIDNLAEGAYH